MDEKQKTYFTGWINWCEIGSGYIPLSFLLGFFVAVVVARWWEQFNWISWPDKMMMMVSACLAGDNNLIVRKTIARWTSLQVEKPKNNYYNNYFAIEMFHHDCIIAMM